MTGKKEKGRKALNWGFPVPGKCVSWNLGTRIESGGDYQEETLLVCKHRELPSKVVVG